MSSAAFPIVKDTQPDEPNNILKHVRQSSVTENTMAVRRHDDSDERLDRMERILERTMEATEKRTLGYNGEKRRSNFIMAGLAIITIVGATGSFIGQSGIFVGGKLKETDQVSEKVKKLEDQIEYLKTWNEKLRNNMAAHGWLIDSVGNVSRVEQRLRR